MTTTNANATSALADMGIITMLMPVTIAVYHNRSDSQIAVAC